MYTYSIGVDRDIKKAVGYLEKAADIFRNSWLEAVSNISKNNLSEEADDTFNDEFDKFHYVNFYSRRCIKAYVQAAYFGSKYALDKVAEIYLESLLAEENKDSDSDTWNEHNFFAESEELLEKGSDFNSPLPSYNEFRSKYGSTYTLFGNQAYFRFCARAAKLGNAKAMVELATMYRDGLVCDETDSNEKYRDGLGIHKDKHKSDRWYAIALKCLEKVANFLIKNKSQLGENPYISFDFDIISGMKELAEINLLGDTSEQNGYQAIALFGKVLELGDNAALTSVAEIFRDGKGGVIPEGKTAIKLFHRAYESGDDSALREIAKIYKDGLGGVIPDGNKAIEILTKIYESGDKSALREIAEIDGKKAIDMLKNACENNDNFALIETAKVYSDGLGGVTPDGNKAIELLNKAYANGDVFALREIAKIYRNGIGGVVPDVNKAIELLSKFCESDDRRVIISLHSTMEDIANVYRLGEGNVEKNIGLAIEWLEKAGCFVEIAEMYRDGVDVRQSGEKAIHYFTKAVEGGSTAAMKEIAKIYKNGIGGVEKNISLATEWFEKSCNLIELAEMYKNGVDVKRNATKAIHYFTKAAELGDTYAMKQLSEIYRQGLDEIEKDLEKSKIWILRMNDLEPYGIF